MHLRSIYSGKDDVVNCIIKVAILQSASEIYTLVNSWIAYCVQSSAGAQEKYYLTSPYSMFEALKERVNRGGDTIYKHYIEKYKD